LCNKWRDANCIIQIDKTRVQREIPPYRIPKNTVLQGNEKRIIVLYRYTELKRFVQKYRGNEHNVLYYSARKRPRKFVDIYLEILPRRTGARTKYLPFSNKSASSCVLFVYLNSSSAMVYIRAFHLAFPSVGIILFFFCTYTINIIKITVVE